MKLGRAALGQRPVRALLVLLPRDPEVLLVPHDVSEHGAAQEDKVLPIRRVRDLQVEPGERRGVPAQHSVDVELPELIPEAVGQALRQVSVCVIGGVNDRRFRRGEEALGWCRLRGEEESEGLSVTSAIPASAWPPVLPSLRSQLAWASPAL
jgi:hypothetical protein